MVRGYEGAKVRRCEGVMNPERYPTSGGQGGRDEVVKFLSNGRNTAA